MVSLVLVGCGDGDSTATPPPSRATSGLSVLCVAWTDDADQPSCYQDFEISDELSERLLDILDLPAVPEAAVRVLELSTDSQVRRATAHLDLVEPAELTDEAIDALRRIQDGQPHPHVTQPAWTEFITASRELVTAAELLRVVPVN